MFTVGVQWTLYGNIATFYPPYRTDNHPSINDTMVGIVLSMFELALLFGSPIVSMFQEKFGRKNFIIMGNSATLVACIGFGLLDYMENDIGFFILSLLLRGVQGFGDACASTTSMSIITIEFTEKKDQYFAYY